MTWCLPKQAKLLSLEHTDGSCTFADAAGLARFRLVHKTKTARGSLGKGDVVLCSFLMGWDMLANTEIALYFGFVLHTQLFRLGIAVAHAHFDVTIRCPGFALTVVRIP